MISRLFFFLFLFVSISDLINVWFELPYRHFTKSLIIPFLILYFANVSPKSRSFYVFLIALVFAWLGDVFLLFSGKEFFLFGLVSFLVMQVIYSILFLKDLESHNTKLILSIILLGLFSVGFNNYLRPFTSEIRIPVIVYSIAIAVMAFSGINREQQLAGYIHIFFGVILFVISDTVLAVHNFADGFWKGGFIVMLTYILAQYFIVEGYSRHLRSSV